MVSINTVFKATAVCDILMQTLPHNTTAISKLKAVLSVVISDCDKKKL